MKFLFTPLLFVLIFISSVRAQSVGIGTAAPKVSAALDITATNKGVLMPRLTTAQRKTIVNPDRALLVFDTDKGSFMLYDGAKWRVLALDDEDKSVLVNRNAPSAKEGDRFGQVVDVAGNYAVVGAPFHRSEVLGNKVGEAFVFFKDSSGWKVQARLAAPDSASFDFYGTAVAIYGDYCVVAASQKAIAGNYSQGKVYVYKRNGTTWKLEAGLTRADGTAGDTFGYSVDITLNSANLPVLAIGAPNAGGTGKVYTYTRVSNTWTYLQTLVPADIANNDQFGLCVSMHQDYLAVGAPAQVKVDNNLSLAGAAYIYVFGGGVFTQQQKVLGYYENAQFGYTFSLYGDKLAIGAPWASANGYATGTAYVVVLKRTGALWDNTYTQFLIPDQEGGSFYMRYGLRLSLNDNNLLIGAPSGIIFPQGSSIGALLPGAVYKYTTADGGVTYYLQEKIVAPTSITGDLFGHSVSIEAGGNYVIGIPFQNAATGADIIPQAGGVYFGY